jgi:hypothetical protein
MKKTVRSGSVGSGLGTGSIKFSGTGTYSEYWLVGYGISSRKGPPKYNSVQREMGNVARLLNFIIKISLSNRKKTKVSNLGERCIEHVKRELMLTM